MREKLINATIVVMMCCTVLMTGLFVRRELFPARRAARSQPTHLEDWHRYARGGHAMGPADAPVTLVAFSDYQCPFCRALASSVTSLRRAYPRELRVVYRHYPLEGLHPYARDAAIAVECAAGLGSFEAPHDSLFAKQDSLGTVLGNARLAALAGVADTAALARCRRDGVAAKRVDADVADGRRLEITGTPTVIINGLRFDGAPTMPVLDSIIRAALSSARVASSQR